MRKLLVVLVVLLVIAGGGFGALWFIQASAAKSQVEEAVAQLNATGKTLSFESISTSGFPSDVVVTLHKPHFAGRVDTLLKAFMPQDPATAAELEKMPEWTGELALDGDMSLRLNLMSDHYSVVMSGDLKSTSTIGGVAETTLSKMNGDSTCHLTLQRSSGLMSALWSLNLNRDGKQFAADFRELNCDLAGGTMRDETGGTLLSSNGGIKLLLSQAPQPNARQFHVYFKSIDAEITPDGDKMYEMFMRTLMPDSSFTPKFSAYGKQNIELDFAFTAPGEGQNMMNAPFDINLTKLSIDSQVYNTNISFQLASSMNGDLRSGKLLLNAESNFAEPYDALVQDVVRGLLDDVYKGKKPEYANLKPYLDKYPEDQAFAIVAPAIPNFHSLGKLAQHIDVSYQGNANLTSGDFNVAALDLSTGLYGISGKGSGKMAPGQLTPATNMTLNCSNCLRMIDDISAYVGRVQKAVAAFDEPSAAPLVIEPRVVEGVKSFLAALAEPAASGAGADNANFTYTIVSDGMMGVTVSGKPMDQVMALYAQYVGQALQPAAGK